MVSVVFVSNFNKKVKPFKPQVLLHTPSVIAPNPCDRPVAPEEAQMELHGQVHRKIHGQTHGKVHGRVHGHGADNVEPVPQWAAPAPLVVVVALLVVAVVVVAVVVAVVAPLVAPLVVAPWYRCHSRSGDHEKWYGKEIWEEDWK